MSNPPAPPTTIRIECPGRRKGEPPFVTVPLLAFYPDWESRLKFRGYAVVPAGALAPQGYAIRSYQGGRYLYVNELCIHLDDWVALMRYCYARHQASVLVDFAAAATVQETALL